MLSNKVGELLLAISVVPQTRSRDPVQLILLEYLTNSVLKCKGLTGKR